MVELTRAHERLQRRAVEGAQFTIGKTEVLVTPTAAATKEADLLIHFHGASWLTFQAAGDRALVVAVVNVGQGGGVYDRTFSDRAAFDALLEGIRARAGVRIHHLYLSGFSAGYGAIRAILRSGNDRVDGILLLDGLHTSYAADRKVDPVAIQPFLDFARAAAEGRKRFVFSHSEIFPGTFASTTETSDYLIQALGLKRTPVVRWGPRGMQQLSEVRAGGLVILGFAGNSAPDHIDQFHAMPEFLQLLLEGGSK